MDPYAAPYSAPRKGISKWWPIGFFITAVIFFIIGGALVGAFVSAGYKTCSTSYYGDYTYDYSCLAGNIGEYNGGIAMLALGGVSKFIGWVLLIVYCVQRRR